MGKSDKVVPTVDEIIATINHSDLKSVIVEGNDDVIIYRQLDFVLRDLEVSIIPVGGRTNVLNIWGRRTELKEFSRVVFIADRDVWVMSKIPDEFVSREIIFTDGYSIENDVIRDGELRKLMTPDEGRKFEMELRSYLKWYSLALSRFFVDSSESLSVNPNHFFADVHTQDTFSKPGDDETFPDPLYAKLVREHERLVRGKCLFPLLMRQLSYKGRNVRHQAHSILEQVAVRRGVLINGLFERVREYFVNTIVV